MHALTNLLAGASVLASVAMAKPVPRATAKQGVTVTQSVPKPVIPWAQQMVNVYKKYNMPVPESLQQASTQSSGSGGGSVPAVPEPSDVAYLCEVNIGGQTFNLDFDTGSADLWVFSTELPKSEQSGHDLYHPSQSSSSKQLQGYTWQIQYGDGSSASGNVFQDTVTIGGVSVTQQAVEAAKQVSSEFEQDPGDGLVGLAFSSINTVQPQQQTTWFETGLQEGLFSQPVFTADLKRGTTGSYDFGYIDSSKHTGSITYTPVNNANGFWEFTGTGYGVGSNNFQRTSIDAIADTGTTLLLMDDSVVSNYYSSVQGAENSSQQGGYIFPCNAQLPEFVLGIGSGQAVIPGSYMNLGAVDSSGQQCFGGLQSNGGAGMSIYGDVFLKAVFAVFDHGNTQFGFAPKSLS